MVMDPNDPCVFCDPEQYVDVFEETLRIDREGPRVYKAVPINPVVPGHVMFIPRTHVKNAAMNPYITAAVFGEAAKHGAIFGPQFNLITSAGVDATQSIMHLHVHYVPRVAGDGLHLPWTDQEW
jgi:histidine triad (HIT) family protein